MIPDIKIYGTQGLTMKNNFNITQLFIWLIDPFTHYDIPLCLSATWKNTGMLFYFIRPNDWFIRERGFGRTYLDGFLLILGVCVLGG